MSVEEGMSLFATLTTAVLWIQRSMESTLGNSLESQKVWTHFIPPVSVSAT